MVKVSVIIPCYNCQAYVRETLDSLACQTYRDFEVVCVNDGSTDETLSVLENYRRQASGFTMQVINQANGGVSSARNAGVQAAEGNYILFLDSDDLYRPEFIALLYNALEQSGTDVAYCRLSRNRDIITETLQEPAVICKTQNEAMRDLLYRMAEISFCCYLYKKDKLVQEGIEFDIHTGHFEDREFNWKYLCHCNSAVLVDAALYYYRVCEDSATQRKIVHWRNDGLNAVERIEAYLEQMKCSFYPELKSYIFPRVMWSMAKNYSVSGAKELFQRLGREYDVKHCMKRTAKDSNRLVCLASHMYLIHPMLFYYVVGLQK